MRLASVILRKWLIDGLLGQLTNVARCTATFSVVDNSPVCAEIIGKADIQYYFTGDVHFNNQPCNGLYYSTVRSQGKSRLNLAGLKRKEVKVGEFLHQKRVYFRGTFLTCEQIIKFIANKLGGAHLNFDRQGQFSKMEEAAAYLTIGGPDRDISDFPSEVYIRLEPKSSEIFTPFHFEVIAAACSFIQIRFDGEPLLQITKTRSVGNWFRDKLGTNKQRYRITDT